VSLDIDALTMPAETHVTVDAPKLIRFVDFIVMTGGNGHFRDPFLRQIAPFPEGISMWRFSFPVDDPGGGVAHLMK
jgi:hypothetical protein